jgi:hypothetical protein
MYVTIENALLEIKVYQKLRMEKDVKKERKSE